MGDNGLEQLLHAEIVTVLDQMEQIPQKGQPLTVFSQNNVPDHVSLNRCYLR
jgi:hypothetical protein